MPDLVEWLETAISERERLAWGATTQVLAEGYGYQEAANHG